MKCDICDRTSDTCRIRTIKGMNLCPKHVTQYYRHHKFLTETIYMPNEYIIYDDYAEIILKNKHCKEIGRAIIDIDDIEKCKPYKWHIRISDKKPYVITSLPQTNSEKIHLHRLIMNYNGNFDIDHINGNGLDNRKSNLRIVNHSINSLNRQTQCGIIKVPSGNYQVRVMKDYEPIYLGTFNNYEEAVDFRKQYVKKYFQEI